MHALISALAFSLSIAVCGSIDLPQEMESKRILETAPNPPNLHVHESDYAWSGWQLVLFLHKIDPTRPGLWHNLIQRAPFTATTSGDGSGSIRIRVGKGQMSTRGTARLQCQRCIVLVALGLNEDTIWRIYLRGIDEACIRLESQHNKRKPKDRG